MSMLTGAAQSCICRKANPGRGVYGALVFLFYHNGAVSLGIARVPMDKCASFMQLLTASVHVAGPVCLLGIRA